MYFEYVYRFVLHLVTKFVVVVTIDCLDFSCH